MYVCLEFGFEGRFRIVDGGQRQLEAIRQRLLQIIRSSAASSSAISRPTGAASAMWRSGGSAGCRSGWSEPSRWWR